MMTYPGDSTSFHSKKSYKRRANYIHLKSSKRPLKKTPGSSHTPIDNEAEKACSKAHLIYKKMLADIALDYYNNKNDTRFEVVEDVTLDSYPFTDFSGNWIHCCFNAKDKDDSSSINKFFAELKYAHPSQPAVTTCKILIQGETKDGCEYCHGKSVTHPVDGYRRDLRVAMEIVEKDKVSGFKPVFPTFDPAPNLDLGAWNEKCRIRDRRIANRALDHYNNTNGTKFALVNEYSIYKARFSGTWIHISFDAIGSSVVKLFFAEIKYDKFSEPAVTICKILEGETKDGCEYCGNPTVSHPVAGYRGDPPVATEIVEKDKDSCYKVYCEEFLGETYVG